MNHSPAMTAICVICADRIPGKRGLTIIKNSLHIPVLLREILDFLSISEGSVCIDMTVGLGGHAEAILEQSAPAGRLLGIDRDAETLVHTRERLAPFGTRVCLVQGTFNQAGVLAERCEFRDVDSILFDLGISSLQLDSLERGFGFSQDGPLDMRMNRQDSLTAADIVNTWQYDQLAEILREYGDERLAKAIAGVICNRRTTRPLETTDELAGLVAGVYKRHGWKRSRMHPATKTFQALRIAVNGELDILREGLEQALRLLAPGGRIGVISFHSGEDRIVKHYFREQEKEQKRGKRITKKPVKAGAEECRNNPRSRSALLRVFQKEKGTRETEE